MEEGAAPKMDLKKMAPVVVIVAVEIDNYRDEGCNVGNGVAECDGGRKNQGGGDGIIVWRCSHGGGGRRKLAGGRKGRRRRRGAGDCHGERRKGSISDTM